MSPEGVSSETTVCRRVDRRARAGRCTDPQDSIHRHEAEERPARDRRPRITPRRSSRSSVNYNVGSRDERKGRTGFAHLFEHMMFKGSENVGQSEHFVPDLHERRHHERHDQQGADALLRDAAGQPARSGAVSRGRSDARRSRSPRTTSTTSATRSRKSAGWASTTSRTARRSKRIDELAYDNFAYEHSVIGSMADLNAASVEDVAAFFKTYYAPNNAVIADRRRRRHARPRSRKWRSTSAPFPRSRRRRRST